MKYNFDLTCGACPEQYDVYIDGTDELVAYVRLRWGALSCTIPDVGGKDIYYHNFEEGYKGEFSNEDEREKYLSLIDSAISTFYGNPI